MNNLCNWCLRDPSVCKDQLMGPCDFIPKYNLCPICKERTIVYKPRCKNCGYEFKTERGDKK